jgi:predicted HAD superfamily Cof-like phosphohydrolase
MNKTQKQVNEFMLKAEQALPPTPTVAVQKTRLLRIKLILEEALEFADACGVEITLGDGVTLSSVKDCDFTQVKAPDLVLMADALCDLPYVVEGSGSAFGLDLEPLQEEVHRSNMSKFIDGHRDPGGKWIKGPSYSPANLAPIIEDQRMHGGKKF